MIQYFLLILNNARRSLVSLSEAIHGLFWLFGCNMVTLNQQSFLRPQIQLQWGWIALIYRYCITSLTINVMFQRRKHMCRHDFASHQIKFQLFSFLLPWRSLLNTLRFASSHLLCMNIGNRRNVTMSHEEFKTDLNYFTRTKKTDAWINSLKLHEPWKCWLSSPCTLY